MSARIIDRTETGFTVQVTIPYNRSMLEFEETLQDRLNAAGVLATEEGRRQFDTDGSPITIGSVTFTSKGQHAKDYQTPYGPATVERHVYQSPQGGATYCPLDRDGGHRQFHPQVRQDGLEQVRRIRLDTRPPRPGDNHGRAVRAAGRGPRRRGGRRGVGQGGRLELPPPQDRDATDDRAPEPGWDLRADV